MLDSWEREGRLEDAVRGSEEGGSELALLGAAEEEDVKRAGRRVTGREEECSMVPADVVLDDGERGEGGDGEGRGKRMGSRRTRGGRGISELAVPRCTPADEKPLLVLVAVGKGRTKRDVGDDVPRTCLDRKKPEGGRGSRRR